MPKSSVRANAKIEAIKAILAPLNDLSRIKISEDSCVFDVTWRFKRKATPRGINDSKLRVEWGRYDLSTPLRYQLQRIFALWWLSPKTFSQRGNKKANSFCQDVRATLQYICLAMRQFPSHSLVESIDVFRMQELRSAARISSGGAQFAVRRGLAAIFNPLSLESVGVSSEINVHDVESLEFPKPGQRQGSQLWLSDDLFAFLSEESLARVHYFLRRLGMRVADSASYARYKPHKTIDEFQDFKVLFEKYTALKRQGGWPPEHYWMKSQGVGRQAMWQFVQEVNRAAITLVALYTGARFSDMASLEVGCVEERDGVLCLAGQEYKTSPDDEFIDDSWVAIPALVDAISALELLADMKNCRFLISGCETVFGSGQKGKDEAYAPHALTRAIQSYATQIDRRGAYKGWSFNIHQFRHALARQFIKVKLGLPYISFQMKHLYNRCSSLPSDITLRYGNSAKLLHATVAGLHLAEVKRDIARSLYDPDARVAGGGAEKFKERRRVYFEGLMATGLTKEQILSRLADEGVDAFVNVGLAYCGGRERAEDGSVPPCIGSLQCNPKDCTNAVITKPFLPAWRAVSVENRMRMGDPRFFYARDQFKLAAEMAEKVLDELDDSEE